MKIEKRKYNIKYLYHYTLKENIEEILNDKQIVSKDKYVFFTKSFNDSVKLFNSEMLDENKIYIDNDGNIKKRGKCSKDDYCILKIPYIEDNNFVKISFPFESNDSVYAMSVVHEGTYKFNNAKVLSIPNMKKHLFNKLFFTTTCMAMLLLPYNAYAKTWLEDNNYDISWYDEAKKVFTIDTKEEVVGLEYLVNKENVTFEGKRVEIKGDIDLTSNDWVTISDIFKGSICGAHRIFLKYTDGKLVSGKDLEGVYYTFEYMKDNSGKEKVSVKYPYTVEMLKKEFAHTTYVFLDNKLLSDDTSLLDLNITKDNTLYVYGRYNYIRAGGILTPICTESGDDSDRIKSLFSLKTGIPVDKMILKYKENIIPDGRTMADFNIQKEEILDIYVKVNANINILEGLGDVTLSKKELLTGDELEISLLPNQDYELSSIFINGINKTNDVVNNKLNIIVGTKDINIEVKYSIKNPQTGDNLNMNVLLFMISLFSLNKLKRKIKN